MGLDSFNRLDIVARDPEAPESGVRVIIVNGRGWDGPDEALLTVQAMVKFSRLLPYAEQQTQAGTPTRLELLNFGEPPDTLLRWHRKRIARHDANLFRDARRRERVISCE